jgi:replicative DNA helicase
MPSHQAKTQHGTSILNSQGNGSGENEASVASSTAAELPEISPKQLERLHQDEAEQIVLGEAMADPRGAHKVTATVAAEDFASATHRHIYRCIRAVYERHGFAPPPAVFAELKERYPDTAARCGVEYLEALLLLAPGYGFPEAYIEALKRASLRRKLVEAAHRLHQTALSDRPPEETLQEALQRMSALHAAAGATALLCPASATAEEIAHTTWVWEKWLPRGHITILAGQPGVGKSALALEVCRRGLLGLDWPDNTPISQPLEKVVYCDSEGAQAINIERMLKWGVPTEAVLLWGAGGLGRLQLTDHQTVASMYNAIRKERIGLVVIDSLRAALGAGLDENDSRVAAVLTPWAELARDTGIALLIVHHFRKIKESESPRASVDRLRGSGAIAAVARVILALDKPDAEEDTVRVSVIKSNLASLPEPLGMIIGPDKIEFTTDAPAPPRRDSVVAQAEEFMRAQLAHRPMSFGELQRRAAEVGISKNSLYRARQKLGIVVVPDQTDPRRKLWSLPANR